MNTKLLAQICTSVRRNIIESTTVAGSGHPTSSLSGVEILVALMFGGYMNLQTNFASSELQEYDRFVLSKGHAAPLLYALYYELGVFSKEQLLSLRKLSSALEGHPTPLLPFVDVATGSLGQGLSAGVGLALGLKKKSIDKKVFVMLGDSECSEGQVWEAIQLASFYKLDNLVAIVDVNRLGQRGETMLGWDLQSYANRFEAFGWNTMVIGKGNDIEVVTDSLKSLEIPHQVRDDKGRVRDDSRKPTVILVHTEKGAGVSFLANADGWHGKPLPADKAEAALTELGKPAAEYHTWRAEVEKNTKPLVLSNEYPKETPYTKPATSDVAYELSASVATREAYGAALLELAKKDKGLIALDAEMSNSTFSELVKKELPEQFIECFIAEQNMVTMGAAMSRLGYNPFVSTFAAFLTRAFDQIRMAHYSRSNLKIVGSHIGASIGPDGSSQMAVEDMAMLGSVLDSVILYPADATATAACTKLMAGYHGLSYMRICREKTPIIYNQNEEFAIGGSKVVREGKSGSPLIIAAGITVHEALKAHNELLEKGIDATIIDAYSVRPLDTVTICKYAKQAPQVLVVEDHGPWGGLASAVFETLAKAQISAPVANLCVRKIPHSGTPTELMRMMEIDAQAIVETLSR